MKFVVIASLVASLQGCADSNEEVWQLEVRRPEGSPCRIHNMDLYLTDRGDGDFAGSVTSQAGTMHVANTHDGYAVEIDEMSNGGLLVGSLHRTPIDGAWPDRIEGSATITGQDCDGQFALTGIAMSLDDYIDHNVQLNGGYSLGECSVLQGEDCPINWRFY